MSRRGAAKLTIAVCIVLLASLSTVRVRQAWGEQQARSSFDAGRHQVAIALRRGSQVGLMASELAPLQRRAATMRRVQSPSSSVFWGSQEAFYSRQAAAYRELAHQIDNEIVTVTRETRSQAESTLAHLQTSVERARTYDVPTTAAQRTLSRESASMARAVSPREFRKIAKTAAAAASVVNFATAQRSNFVSSLLKSSGTTTTGVQTAVDNEAAASRSRLSMIALFSPRGSALGGQLDRATVGVHAQGNAFDAAVKALSVHDLDIQISRLYDRTVPTKFIVVSTQDQSARMYENGTQVYESPVTTGGPELPTDRGIFHIYDKISPFVFHSPWPEGSPYYYPPTPVQFWMPFDGAEGLHDASWRSNFGPGSNFAPTDLGTGNTILGTHGCVNLPYDAASFVWDWAPLGTMVVVT